MKNEKKKYRQFNGNEGVLYDSISDFLHKSGDTTKVNDLRLTLNRNDQVFKHLKEF